jgi:hypothetical protein
VNDIGVTDCGHTIIAMTGGNSLTDVENGMPVHRVGDVVIVVDGGVGVSVTGSDTLSSE